MRKQNLKSHSHHFMNSVHHSSAVEIIHNYVAEKKEEEAKKRKAIYSYFVQHAYQS